MTIIKPIEVKNGVKFLIFLFITVFASGVFYVLEYNSLVSARYQVNSLKKQLADASVLSAELKSRLYKTTDPVELQTLAAKYNLTLERKPQYLNQNQWVSVSSYSQ